MAGFPCEICPHELTCKHECRTFRRYTNEVNTKTRLRALDAFRARLQQRYQDREPNY